MSQKEHPNVGLVREGFDAFQKGDMAWMDAHIADNVIWHVGGNSKWSGSYEGKAKALLTDGTISVSGAGDERKTFHIRDGAAIVWAQRAGLEIGLLSGRDSAARRWRRSHAPYARSSLARSNGHSDRSAASAVSKVRASPARSASAYRNATTSAGEPHSPATWLSCAAMSRSASSSPLQAAASARCPNVTNRRYGW